MTIYLYKDQKRALADSKNGFSKSLRKNLKYDNGKSYTFFLFKDKKTDPQHIDIFNKSEFIKANSELEPEFRNKKKYKACYTYSNINEKSKFKKQDYLIFQKKKLISIKINNNSSNDGGDPFENNFNKKDKLSGGLYKTQLKKIIEKETLKVNNDSETFTQTDKPLFNEYGNSQSMNFVRNNLTNSSQGGFTGSGWRMTSGQQNNNNNNNNNFNNQNGPSGNGQNGGNGNTGNNANNGTNNNANNGNQRRLYNFNAFRLGRFFSSATAQNYFNALAAATAASMLRYLWRTGRNYNIIRHYNTFHRIPLNRRYLLQNRWGLGVNGNQSRINSNRIFFDTVFERQRIRFNQNRIIGGRTAVDNFFQDANDIRARTTISETGIGNNNRRTRHLANLMVTLYNFFPLAQSSFNLIVNTITPNLIGIVSSLWNFWCTFRIFISSTYFIGRFNRAALQRRNLISRFRTFSINLVSNTIDIITQTWIFETQINTNVGIFSARDQESAPNSRAILLEIRHETISHTNDQQFANLDITQLDQAFAAIWTERSVDGPRNVLYLSHLTDGMIRTQNTSHRPIPHYSTIIASDNITDLWDPSSDYSR